MEGNPSGFKATTEALEAHFATSTHIERYHVGFPTELHNVVRCSHGVYTYGGPKGDRTVIEVPDACPPEIVQSSWTPDSSQLDLLKNRYRVVSVQQETPDTISILTDFPITWAPGQFSMLGVPGGGEVPISFSGKRYWDSNIGYVTMQTIRSVGRVTAAIACLRPGSIVTQRGPFGQGWQYQPHNSLILVAGGCGIAPLRPVIDTHRGSMIILYGARTHEDFYFRQDTWFEDIFRITNDYGTVVDRIQPWMIDKDDIALVCGPEPMMRAAADKLVELGLSEKHIQISLERHMTCAIGVCGRCGVGGGHMCCKDGPVFKFSDFEKFSVGGSTK